MSSPWKPTGKLRALVQHLLDRYRGCEPPVPSNLELRRRVRKLNENGVYEDALYAQEVLVGKLIEEGGGLPSGVSSSEWDRLVRLMNASSLQLIGMKDTGADPFRLKLIVIRLGWAACVRAHGCYPSRRSAGPCLG